MTKPEALDLLARNNCLNHNCSHQAWKEVFKFYKDSTGDRSVTICCDSCHSKILKWLRS